MGSPGATAPVPPPENRPVVGKSGNEYLLRLVKANDVNLTFAPVAGGGKKKKQADAGELAHLGGPSISAENSALGLPPSLQTTEKGKRRFLPGEDGHGQGLDLRAEPACARALLIK